MNYTPMRVGEIEIFSVDYSRNLAPGETITSAVWSNSVRAGTDATANSMILGSAIVEGPKVSQLISAGKAGTTYAPVCKAQTSLGQTIILPDPGEGSLTVVAA